MDLSNKVAVITGAGSGIGRALSMQLHAAGCRLALSDVNADNLAALAADLKDGAGVFTQTVDVADRVAMETWAGEVEQRFGGADILVNNAGVALVTTAEDAGYDDFHWLMNINFWGVVHGCKSFLPLLRRAPEASIINISSVFGLISVPGQATYNAAKFAVRGYTEALRLELADSRIKVCCVHPGGIKTNIAQAARRPDSKAAKQYDVDPGEFEQLARTTPDQAAAKIVNAIVRGKKRLLIGLDAHVISLLCRLFPVRYAKAFKLLEFGRGR
jgi:NAD(P)-dependent dehydrogenase (short-subunit alcohol dehydrogenase family)